MAELKTHYVKLPQKFRNDYFSGWLMYAAFTLLSEYEVSVNKCSDTKKGKLVISLDETEIAEIKKGKLISTRVKTCSETEHFIQQLSKKYKLSKLDTFLFVFTFIEKNPSFFFNKNHCSTTTSKDLNHEIS